MKTLIYVVNAVVHCSISVIEVDVLAFFETRTMELSRVSTRLSSSLNSDRVLGRSLDNSKNSPDCISFTY